MNSTISRRSLWARIGLILACLAPAIAAHAGANPYTLEVSVPNGYATASVNDLTLQSTAGPVKWTRVWNGWEWKFNPHWESLSQSWKNLTGSKVADTTGSGTVSGGATQNYAKQNGDSGCWVWVDEDWEPTIGTTVVGGSPEASPLIALRSQPFNRMIGLDGAIAQVDYPPPQVVNIDYANLCYGTSLSTGAIDFEAIRRQNELYLGNAGRYAFDNRTVLEKRAVLQLPQLDRPILQGQLATGRFTATPESNSKGFRWSDRGGDWIDYNTQGQVVAYGDANNNVVRLARDTLGTVQGVVDANGRVLLTIHYDVNDRVSEVRDYPIAGMAEDLPPRSVKYQYDSKHRLHIVTDARGYDTVYDYDLMNNIVKVTDPELREDKWAYDSNIVKQHTAADGGVTDYMFDYDDVNKQFNSKITGPETESGRRVENLTHNRSGKIVRQVLNGIVNEEVRYDSGERAEIHTNSRGFTTRIVRNEFEQVVRTELPDSTARQSGYATANLALVEEIDETGAKSSYERDSRGNLLRITRGVGSDDERVTEFEVNAHGMPTAVTRKGRVEANGVVTPDAQWKIEYDEQGQIKQTTDPEGKVRLYTFSRTGDVVRHTDPKGKLWRYTYDANGNLVEERDPLEHLTTYTYDKTGNALTLTDPLHHTWRWEYDAKGRETKSVDPYQAEYTTAYNKAGGRSSVIDASGKTMSVAYDALLRVIEGKDGKGNSYRYEYTDADGAEKGAVRPTKIRYPTFDRIFRYDERDRPRLKSDVVGEEGRVDGFTYDGAGRRLTATDANGKTRYYEYNAHGELKVLKDPLGNSVRVLRDARGNVIEITDPNGHKTGQSFDRRNLLVASTDPLGKSTGYAYDDRGWLEEIRQANGQRVTYEYDDAGRIQQHREFATGGALVKTVDYLYDDAGNLKGWSDGTASAVRTYDDADRLLSETVNYGGFSLGYSFTYYPNNQLKTYTGPDGVTVGYRHDALGQLDQVEIPGEGTISVAEWQWTSPTKVVLPGGTVQQYEYDGYQSLKGLKVVNPAQATVFELRNEFGKLAELAQARFDGTARSYGYDDATRLKTISAPQESGRSETFDLDAASNRTSHSRTGSAVWRYDDANQLAERGTVSYQYDDSGNQIRKIDSSLPEPQRTTKYEYDAFNRLVKVSDGADALIARYTYDPFDRRLSKILGTGQVVNFLPSQWGLLAEADGAGAIRTTYGWNPQYENSTAPLFARVPSASGGFRYVYYHNDHLGTPQRVTDKTGALVWAADYDGFGRATVRSTTNDPLISNLRYAGQYYDEETGLHYNDRRYYDPDTGRYVSRDPIGFEGGINLYAYAAHSPSNFHDPTGEIIPCIIANYARCFVMCNITDGALDLITEGCVDLFGNAKDCARDCLFDMIPWPNPCGRFGKYFSAAMGVVGGLMNSFSADTLVSVKADDSSLGGTTPFKSDLKPISQLKIGDQVLALAEWEVSRSAEASTAGLRFEYIKDIIHSERTQNVVHVTLDTGETIRATEGHPFKTMGGWKDAKLLNVGDEILRQVPGENAKVVTLSLETARVAVFNLEVSNAHTFYVGESGVLVHNGFGSYTITFPDDTKYHGKGDFDRAKKSARRVGRVTGHYPCKGVDYRDWIDWTPAVDDDDAYGQEADRLHRDGGPQHPSRGGDGRNHNKVNSPGRRR